MGYLVYIGAGGRLPQRGLRIDLREGGPAWAGLSSVRSSVTLEKGPKGQNFSLNSCSATSFFEEVLSYQVLKEIRLAKCK